jgi:hypothetical protein
MQSPVHHLTIIRYYRDDRPQDSKVIFNPTWRDIKDAVRKMDNYCFPIIQLNLNEEDDDENIFNIIGGNGRFALFHLMGDWQYEDPNGGDDEVRLWESDQGYYCCAKNVLTDIKKVLRITKVFYETGSYDNLDVVE